MNIIPLETSDLKKIIENNRTYKEMYSILKQPMLRNYRHLCGIETVLKAWFDYPPLAAKIVNSMLLFLKEQKIWEREESYVYEEDQ